jgi:hypothetical protein
MMGRAPILFAIFFECRNTVLFPVLNSLPQVVLLKSDSGETGERIEFLISLMIKELKNTRPGFYAAIDQMAFLIFIEVLRKQMDNNALEDGLLRALFDSRLGRALNAIHQRAELPWTLE